MKNSEEPIYPTIYRQTGDNSYKIASEKDLKEGIYLSSKTGLTKREHFAALAMQGILSNPNSYKDGVAEDALKIANELLKLLNEKGGIEI
jgi:hypothetical protein